MINIIYELKNNKIYNIQYPETEESLNSIINEKIENTDYFLNPDYDLQKDQNFIGLKDQFGNFNYQKGSGNIPVLISNSEKLENLKNGYINKISLMSFNIRNSKLPEYRISNASIDVYDEATKTSYKNMILDFRTEFYRMKGLIEAAESESEIITIIEGEQFSTIELS